MAPSEPARNSAVAALRRPAAVADPDRQRRAGRGARRPSSPGAGRLLDELLVAPLERAVPLPDRDDRSDRVAQQLDLDVARRDGSRARGRRSRRRTPRPPQPIRRRARRAGRRRRATRRMPRPPPPAAALTSSGKPIGSASATMAATCVGRSTGAGVERPGHAPDADRRAPSVGRGACRRARRSAAGGGRRRRARPSSTARAKAARSDRKP